MINNIKFIIKCQKFTPNRRIALLILLGSLIGGYTGYYISHDMMLNLPFSLFLLMCCYMYHQNLVSLSRSKLFSSSPMKKSFLINITTLSNVICAIIGFLVSFFGFFMQYYSSYYDANGLAYMIATNGLMLFLVMIYYALIYKYFFFGIIILITGFFAPLYKAYDIYDICVNLHLTVPIAFVIAIIMIALGAMISYIISRLSYKKEFNKLAFSSSLQREI